MTSKLKLSLGFIMVTLVMGCGMLDLPQPTLTPIRPPTVTPVPVNTPMIFETPVITPGTQSPTATPLANPVGIQLRILHMIDVQNGWGVGKIEGNPNDLIIRTFDGGATWRSVTPPAILVHKVVGGEYASVYFMDLNKAWTIYTPNDLAQQGAPVIVWRTVDGGKNWQPSQPLNLSGIQMEFFKPSDLGFTIEQTGYLLAHLGAGMNHDYIAIFTSPDGGESWTPVVTPANDTPPASCAKSGIVFFDAKTGWVTGDCPGLQSGVYFYLTTDGGKNWKVVDLPIPQNQPEIFKKQGGLCGMPQAPIYLDARTIYTVVRCSSGDTNTLVSWLYTSRDGGQNWITQTLPAPYGTLLMLDLNLAWYMGGNDREGNGGAKLYRSVDGGMTWPVISQMIWHGPLVFAGPQIGWVIAYSGAASTLVKTTNGGSSWKDVKPVLVP